MKACSVCVEVKPMGSFGFDKRKKDGRTSACRVCIREQSKQTYQRHRESRVARVKAYKEKNPEIVKERLARSTKQWAQRNKHKLNAAGARYRATKLKATPPWLTEGHIREIETEYELASWCSEVQGYKYHVDHIVPLQGKKVCGLHVPWNLQVIPAKVNHQKSNKFQIQ